MVNICEVCGTKTKLDVCPQCDIILIGENKGKDSHEIEAKGKKHK